MKIFYQLSMHRDREWYRPFQGFRYYLVEYEVTLEEQIKNKLNFNGKYVNIDFEPYKIKTCYLEI